MPTTSANVFAPGGISAAQSGAGRSIDAEMAASTGIALKRIFFITRLNLLVFHATGCRGELLENKIFLTFYAELSGTVKVFRDSADN
jgi:hypothetical protein